MGKGYRQLELPFEGTEGTRNESEEVIEWMTDNAIITVKRMEQQVNGAGWHEEGEESVVANIEFDTSLLSLGAASILEIFDPVFGLLKNSAVRTNVKLTIVNGEIISGSLSITTPAGWYSVYDFDQGSTIGVGRKLRLGYGDGDDTLILRDEAGQAYFYTGDVCIPDKIDSIQEKIIAYYLYLVEIMRTSKIIEGDFWNEFAYAEHNLPLGDIFGNGMYFNGVTDNGLIELRISSDELSPLVKREEDLLDLVVMIPVVEVNDRDYDFTVEFVERGAVGHSREPLERFIATHRQKVYRLLYALPNGTNAHDILYFWYPLLAEINDKLQVVTLVDNDSCANSWLEIVEELMKNGRPTMIQAQEIMRNAQGDFQSRVERWLHLPNPAVTHDRRITTPKGIYDLCNILSACSR